MTCMSILATARNTRDKQSYQRNERVTWIDCDVQSEQSVDAIVKELKKYSPIKMIYLVAYHHPESVEKYKSLAWDVNVVSFARFVNKVSFVDCLYFISTDCVYGDSINYYHFKEEDRLNPVNYYGHCKCAGEAIAIHSGRNVVRLPFLISPSITNKKHFYDVIVDNLKQGKPVEMYSDSYRSSLGFDQAAELVVELIEKNKEHPIVNVCGDEDLSKYEVGIRIADRELLDEKLIVPVLAMRSAEWNSVKRAYSTLMDNSLLKSILGIERINLFENINLT